MKNRFKICIPLLSLFLLFSIDRNCENLFAQKAKIDSLFSLLKKDAPDTNKVNHLNKLSNLELNLGLYDTALSLSNSSLELAIQLDFKPGLATANYTKGLIYWYKNDNIKALTYWTDALKVNRLLNDEKQIARTLTCIGSVYLNLADYSKALDNYLMALKIDEEMGNKNNIAVNLSNIGNIYYLQKEDYPKALEYYFKALTLSKEAGFQSLYANTMGNIGSVYTQEKDYVKALDYLSKTLPLSENVGDKQLQAKTFDNIGNVYFNKKNYPEALINYFKAISIFEDTRDSLGIALACTNIGSVYEANKKFKDAENYYKKAIEIEKNIYSLDYLRQSEESLSQLYDTTAQQALIQKQFVKAATDFKNSMFYYKKATALKDTIFSQTNKKQLVQKEMNYEFDKKEAVTKLEIDKQQLKKNLIIYSVIGGLLLVLVFSGFIFRSLRVTRKQKQIIEVKEKKSQQQNGIITQQKHLIEQKHKEITDSINYAERIQRSLLASTDLLDRNLKEYFVYFQPKDIVSGDFYWAHILNNGNFALLTADSTGHGVPGAIMSILNISCLEKAIEVEKLIEPAEILNHTRTKIIETLKKDGSAEGGKDGMDCSLISFNFSGNKVSYAAANNPIWIVRKKKIIVLAPDKMPVGKHDKETVSFIQNTIYLEKGDVIYAITDGMSDQFGGPNSKKFMSKQLRELLISISDLPMQEQKEKLSHALNDWKGNLEQVDDVTIIGVRV